MKPYAAVYSYHTGCEIVPSYALPVDMIVPNQALLVTTPTGSVVHVTVMVEGGHSEAESRLRDLANAVIGGRDISHNEIAALCQAALIALGVNPTEHETEIKDFATTYDGNRMQAPACAAHWTRERRPDLSIKQARKLVRQAVDRMFPVGALVYLRGDSGHTVYDVTQMCDSADSITVLDAAIGTHRQYKYYDLVLA